MTHLRTVYYRARFQGGDTQQPLCLKPRYGWAGEDAAALPMTDFMDAVSCPICKRLAEGQKRRLVRLRPPREPSVKPGLHEKHLRLIWLASRGMMFPFCVERRAA